MGFLRAAFIVSCFAVLSDVFCDDCLEGQSAWCRDLKQAIKCSAVNHCKATAWKKEFPHEDPSEECVFCESIVQDVIKFIIRNESMEFIEKFMMDACDLIPITTISAECKMLVKEDLPYIIELIKEKVDPKVICGLLGFCKNQFNNFGVEKSKDEHIMIQNNEKFENLIGKGICQECKDFAKMVKDNLLSKETEKRVLLFMNDVVCNFFIIGKEKCKELSTRYVAKFFDELRRNFDPDKLCAVFCHGSLNNPLYKRAAHLFNMLKTSKSGCVVCNELKETIKNDLNDMKATGSDAFWLLGPMICSAINERESVECINEVKTFGGKLLAFLSDEKLDAVCRNLCDFDVPVEHNTKAEADKPPLMYTSEMNGDKCQTCQIVAQYLEALLDTDVVVSEIEHLVSKICTFLPKTMQPSCHAMIEEYGPIIVHYIAVYASPREVCKFINLCNSGEHHKCIQGPSFWCVSPVNVKLCMAEEYCKKHVWA